MRGPFVRIAAVVGGFLAAGAALPAGQFIYVVPALDLVVVTTGNSEISPDQLKDHRRIIRELVVPAERR